MGHWVTAYWYGKNAAASLFGTGPSYGMSSQEVMGWMEYGGGRKLYEEAVASQLVLITLVSFICLCQHNLLVGLKKM